MQRSLIQIEEIPAPQVKLLVSPYYPIIFKQFVEKLGAEFVSWVKAEPERIYNPITAMGFSAMFTFQLDNTKR